MAASVQRLHRYLTEKFPLSWLITVADNASNDNTWAIACGLAKKLDCVRALHLEQKGRGRALQCRKLGLARERQLGEGGTVGDGGRVDVGEDAGPAGGPRLSNRDECAQGRELRLLAHLGSARLELVVEGGGLGHGSAHASQRLRRL